LSTAPTKSASGAPQNPASAPVRRSKPISTPGSTTTTPSGPTSDTETWAEDPSKPSCHSSVKKVKWTGLAHSFLDGQAAPAITSRESWDRLGWEWRMVWPIDARLVAWASWFMNPGA
jgi:hypothetical protein